MANFKRRKSRRIVRCTMCTPYRWQGNGKGRFKTRDVIARDRASTCVDTSELIEGPNCGERGVLSCVAHNDLA
jgi:hypothetical protein